MSITKKVSRFQSLVILSILSVSMVSISHATDAKEISQIGSEAKEYIERVKLSDPSILAIVRNNIDVYIQRSEAFLSTVKVTSMAQSKKKMTLLKQVKESKVSLERQKEFMSPVMESIMASQLEKIENDVIEGRNDLAAKRVHRSLLVLKGIKKII